MTITGKTFTVGQNSTLAGLDAFLKTNANKDSTILGRHNQQGEVVLYVASKPASLLDRILGRTERRQETAREGIQTVFTRFEASSAASRGTGSGKAGSDLLFEHVTAVLNYKAQTGITSEDVRNLAVAAKEISRALPTAPSAQPAATPSSGPTLRGVGIRPNNITIPNTARNWAAELARGGEGDAAADALGDKIASRFKAKHGSQSSRDGFALSDGTALRNELRDALRNAFNAPAAAGPKPSNVQLEQFVNRAVNRAAAQMMADTAVPGTSTPTPSVGGHTVDLPNIRLGGEEFRPTGFLGEGGFANVYSYTSVSDPNRKIAFKLAKDDSPEAVADVATEIKAHKSAFGKGCDQVIGLEGKVRLPDGRLGIAVEMAPNGNVQQMSETIRAAIDANPQQGSGKITAAEANILRLTMIQDMAKGLKHLHGQQGMTHYDFKSPNCFIGTDGTSKVADFGLSLQSTATALLDAKRVDNPLFKAPEIMRAENVKSRINDFARETARTEMNREKAHLRELLPLATEDAINTLAGSVFEPRQAEIESAKNSDLTMLFFDRKVDTWGLGASALELFTGKLPMEHKLTKFMSQAEDAVSAFGASRNNQPLGDPGPDGSPASGALGLRTGDAEIDNLLSGMLTPDPRDRSGPTGILNSAALKRDGVGSNEAKALIVALKSGDPAKIDLARMALALAM